MTVYVLVLDLHMSMHKTAGSISGRISKLVDASHKMEGKFLSNQFGLFKSSSSVPILSFMTQETVMSSGEVEGATTSPRCGTCTANEIIKRELTKLTQPI